MTGALFVGLYLLAVLYVGIFAFRGKSGESSAESFFVANRSLGTAVFVLSLFGTHMTAFAILGSSGHAFRNGIVTFGLMASSSAFVVPLLLLFVGTRLWSAGRRFGLMTPVQIFRDRWECGHIGTFIFVVQALLLLPYIVVGVMGGGTAMRAITGGLVPFWLGGLIVALVVMSYVFFGGMRGTAFVNAMQTILFLSFGTIAVVVIGAGMGGFAGTVERLLADAKTSALLTRERISPSYFFSYTFIPLSAIAFPHISIFCLTAKKLTQFKRTVVLYPLCILAIWLPCVFLGVLANGSDLVPKTARDEVLLLLLGQYAPVWLAGLLGAGIMSAVMASDSQILALSTMFAEDVFAYYGHKERWGERVQIATARAFIVVLTAAAYWIAMKAPGNIFELASQYAFTGYAALSPLVIAALCWRGSTKWGALASTLWVAGAVGVIVWKQPPPSFTINGFLPVVPITLISAMLMIVVSLVTPRPSAATVERYFAPKQ